MDKPTHNHRAEKDKELAKNIYEYYGFIHGSPAIMQTGMLPKGTKAAKDATPLEKTVHNRLRELSKQSSSCAAGPLEYEALMAAQIAVIRVKEKWKIDRHATSQDIDAQNAERVRRYYGQIEGVPAIGTLGQVPSERPSTNASGFEIAMWCRLNNLCNSDGTNSAGPEEAQALKDAGLTVAPVEGQNNRWVIESLAGERTAAASQAMTVAPSLPDLPVQTEAFPEDPSHAQYTQDPGSFDGYGDWDATQNVYSDQMMPDALHPVASGSRFAMYLPQETDLSAHTSSGSMNWQPADSAAASSMYHSTPAASYDYAGVELSRGLDGMTLNAHWPDDEMDFQASGFFEDALPHEPGAFLSTEVEQSAWGPSAGSSSYSEQPYDAAMYWQGQGSNHGRAM